MTDGNVRSLSLPPPRASTRELAAWAIERTLEERRPLAADLATAEALCNPRDRGLLRQLVLGTVRWLLRLDDIVEQASSRPLRRIDPLILAPLRLGVYQLVFLDGVPAHAAVDQSVAMARSRTHKGAAGFVNAVLRRVARKPRLEDWPVLGATSISRLATEQSHPLFLTATATCTGTTPASENRPRPVAASAPAPAPASSHASTPRRASDHNSATPASPKLKVKAGR